MEPVHAVSFNPNRHRGYIFDQKEPFDDVQLARHRYREPPGPEVARPVPIFPLNAGDAEPGLSEVLALIQEDPREREQFAYIFIEMLQGKRESPEWLIAYCMRTLRWPEIEQAAEAVRASGDANKLPLPWEVLDAYDDDEEWVGVHLFKRYTKSTI